MANEDFLEDLNADELFIGNDLLDDQSLPTLDDLMTGMASPWMPERLAEQMAKYEIMK